MLNKVHKIRERINIFIYDSKENALRILKVLNVIISLGAVGTLIYYYGFPHTEQNAEILLGIIRGSFIFYISAFFVRLFYDFHPLKFLRKNWVEGVVILLLLIEGLADTLFNTMISSELFEAVGIMNADDVSRLIVQLYFFIVVIVELSRNSINFLPLFKLHPAQIFMLGIALIIFIGTFLLMLPEMSSSGEGISFLDALFTSTSATCVTGLATIDVSAELSTKGQIVLMILMKMGGLNVIAFGSFVALASKLGMQVKQNEDLKDFTAESNILGARSMLQKVILWSTFIELCGAFLIFNFWGDSVPKLNENTGDKIFHSLFHSISAFNNAGFSLFTNSFYEDGLRDNYFLHATLAILIILGGLGFLAIFDLFGIDRLRERMQKPWKQIEFSTKIALYFSIGLIIIGAIAVFALEYNNQLADKPLGGKISHALFQSVTARTAGFNTLDTGGLNVPTLILIITLMFIGTSSGSTGGGMKTSTLAVIYASMMSNLKGRSNAELFKRTITKDMAFKAFSIIVFFLLGNLICIFALSITEAESLRNGTMQFSDILFEQVSAWCTTGLSTGITASLSDAGKVVILIAMYVGRVGTLTIAFLFVSKTISKNYKYPVGKTMIG
jgi:Trk-type K+ transport system membrane component